MPYTTDNPPDRIKALPPHAQKIWVSAFNAALDEYKDEGKANATAWSAVEKAGYKKDENGEWHKVRSMQMDIKELWDKIRGIFEPMLADENRAAYSWDQCMADAMKEYGDKATAEKVCGAIKAGRSVDESGAILLPAGFDLQATLREIEQQLGIKPLAARSIAYLPLQTRALTVTRLADGKPRWLMIAASAVVNKVNAIDSTTLFDNFIRHAQETKEYPTLDFLHERETIRFGVADWLHRDGALYIASGTFDDTNLARAAADGLEKDPAYWGASISYRITQPPMILQAEGSIPVYTDGVNDFISIVPKRMAANLFTAAEVTKEVNRMDKAAYDELVKLVGPEAAKQFADQVDESNRTITETGMVVRAEATTTPPEVTAIMATNATTNTTNTEPPATETRDVVVPAAVVAPAEATPQPTLADVVSKVNELAAQVADLKAMYGMMQEASVRSAEDQKRAVTTLDDVAQRLKSVESLSVRWKQWLDDAPEHVKAAEGIIRARDQEPVPMTYAQIAEQNLSKMNRGQADWYHVFCRKQTETVVHLVVKGKDVKHEVIGLMTAK